jgi:MYXO-CTERM domain-containing protein
MKKITNHLVAAILCCSLTVTTSVQAQNDTNAGTYQNADRNDDDDDNTGKWGLAGLLGLLGLLGLRKKDDDNRTRVNRNP